FRACSNGLKSVLRCLHTGSVSQSSTMWRTCQFKNRSRSGSCGDVNLGSHGHFLRSMSTIDTSNFRRTVRHTAWVEGNLSHGLPPEMEVGVRRCFGFLASIHVTRNKSRFTLSNPYHQDFLVFFWRTPRSASGS